MTGALFYFQYKSLDRFVIPANVESLLGICRRCSTSSCKTASIGSGFRKSTKNTHDKSSLIATNELSDTRQDQLIQSRSTLQQRCRLLQQTICWSKTQPTILAALDYHEVFLLNDEGESYVPSSNIGSQNGINTHTNTGGSPMLIDAAIQRTQSNTTCADWHPNNSIIAVGWDDGCITLYNEKIHSRLRDSQRPTEITFIRWSPDGIHLIVSDKNSTVVYGLDARSNLAVVREYPVGNVSHLTFMTNAPCSNNALAASSVDSLNFFIAKENCVWFLDNVKHRIALTLPVNESILFLHYSSKGYLVAITSLLNLIKFKIPENGENKIDRQIQLSIRGSAEQLSVEFVGNGYIAGAYNDSTVRLWNIEDDSTQQLTHEWLDQKKDVVRLIAFDSQRSILAGITQKGKVIMWKHVGDDHWDPLPPVNSKEGVSVMRWSSQEGLLGLVSNESLSILNETILQSKTFQQHSIVQVSINTVQLQLGETKRSMKLQSSLRIKGLDMNSEHILFWSGKTVEIRSIFGSTGGIGDFAVVHSFKSRAMICAIRGESIYMIVDGKIHVVNLSGVPKSIIAIGQSEGLPTHIHLQGDFLAVVTSVGILKLWDVSRREPKQIVQARQIPNGHTARQLQVNVDGSKIGLLLDTIYDAGVKRSSNKVVIFDVEVDKFFEYLTDKNYVPVSLFWDDTDPRFFVIQTKMIIDQSTSRSTALEGYAASGENEVRLPMAEVNSLFASDTGVFLQDSLSINPQTESLLGVQVPYMIFLSRFDVENPQVERRPMRDFVGLEKVNDETRRDLMNFSFYLVMGNMDAAYRSIKKINSEAIWENMARRCVKTKRLDVAEVCLGNMNNAQGVRALRDAMLEPQLECAVAMLAIQLRMFEDAERLYIECNRFDLLVRLYISCARYKDAIRIAEKYDRVHLKMVHYLYAKQLETNVDTAGAIKEYEASGMHRQEVPRMLFEMQDLHMLETYITDSEDPVLYKWWAQYCEGNGFYDDAIRFYSLANDSLGIVRVYCFRGEEDKAAAQCNASGDAAACYQLALHYEDGGNIQEAIAFYVKAKRLNHAIRLAKENSLDHELLQLSLKSSKLLQLDAARWFDSNGMYDKAVLLYSKGGNISRAVDLCFAAQLFDALGQISDNLGADSDPELLSKCGNFFMQHQQYDKAANLFIYAKNYEAALDLCVTHHIAISDEMAEKMTPPKSKDDKSNALRSKLLRTLAQLCRDQGSYHTACKKFTQAGEHVQAMKCLLKSMDTEKIIYYANMTKQKEIFILAGNYLQSLDWHSDPEIMKTIINFYTKSKSNDALARFYESCAQVEIDSYRDYEKALSALREALKLSIKANFAESILTTLDNRIKLVEQFVDVRHLVLTDPKKAIEMCNELINEDNIEHAVRVGDVYALLAEYYASIKQWPQAYSTIQRMLQANISLSSYLDENFVQRVYAAVGLTSDLE